MSTQIYPISLELTSPDAAAALQLRVTLGALCAADQRLGFDPGPVNEITLKGADEPHLDSVVDRLKREFGLAFTAGAPQVAYREAITRAAQGEFTHKRQTGGRGSYAKVRIGLAPAEAGSGFVFTDATPRGMLRPDFVAAVERGLREAAAHGPIADVPLMDLVCTLVDGAYHDVDSTPEAFEIAARACLKETLRQARPKLLEPMMKVEVVTPWSYPGDVIGDLMSRRGQIQGMDDHRDLVFITATVPLANLFGYPTTLKFMTQGRAQVEMTFSHYEPVPIRPGGDDPFASAAALR